MKKIKPASIPGILSPCPCELCVRFRSPSGGWCVTSLEPRLSYRPLEKKWFEVAGCDCIYCVISCECPTLDSNGVDDYNQGITVKSILTTEQILSREDISLELRQSLAYNLDLFR